MQMIKMLVGFYEQAHDCERMSHSQSNKVVYCFSLVLSKFNYSPGSALVEVNWPYDGQKNQLLNMINNYRASTPQS